MTMPLTIEQVAKNVLQMVEDIVTNKSPDLPEEEREEARQKLLDAWLDSHRQT